MNETIDHLVWPVVYVELGRDEELMLISDTDWFHDIDAKHAIGPIEDGQHYFVDAVSQTRETGTGPILFGTRFVRV